MRCHFGVFPDEGKIDFCLKNPGSAIYCFPRQIPRAKGWRGVKLQLIMEYVVMEIIFNSFDPKTITNIVHDRFLDAENIIWDK